MLQNKKQIKVFLERFLLGRFAKLCEEKEEDYYFIMRYKYSIYRYTNGIVT